MSDSTIHIYEENINLFWGLTGLISIAGGVYLLAGAFFGGSWQWLGVQQIFSLVLFTIGFYTIIRLTSPLYNFKIYLENGLLQVEIWQGADKHISTKKIEINEITELKITPHSPRKENEALFDFSSNYILLYRTGQEPVWSPLIELRNHSFTLKIEDIRKIMQFLKDYNTTISTGEYLNY